MFNRITAVGRLVRDPELRRTATDVAIASFPIAISDLEKDANGERTTTFIDVTVWRYQADNTAKYCRKGDLVLVDGRIRQRRFERKDGTKGSTFEIVANSIKFLEPKKDIPQGAELIDEPAPDESKNLDSIDVTDDDLPF